MFRFYWLRVLIIITMICGIMASVLILPPQTTEKPRSTSGPQPELEDYDYSNFEGFEFLISGGYRPERHTLAKYMVSLRTSKPSEYFGDNHYCGGAIIASTLILTAAHCVMDLNKVVTRSRRIIVVAGAPNRLVHEKYTVELDVDAVIPHSKFRRTGGHDIAILRLAKPIPHDNDYMKIINMVKKTPPPGTNCTALGWGRLFKRGPYAASAVYVDLDIAKTADCYEKYPIFDKGMLCSIDKSGEEKDINRGDTGGPLICGRLLAGIISWDMPCNPACSMLFTDVAYHRKWIRAIDAGTDLRPSWAGLVSVVISTGIFF